MDNTNRREYVYHMLRWLWLTTKNGISSAKITMLLEYFESVDEIYAAKSYNHVPGLNEKDKAALMNKDLDRAKRTAKKSAKINTRIIAFDSELYPEMLKNIDIPPYVLYVQGSMPRFDEILTIGVVGTRESSDYGRAVTNEICSDLARAGVITVGGLARGIDSVGAWATLDAGGTAVGVVGNGLDIAYPTENTELIQEITEKGCIISEYPPGSPPLRTHFPERNRIIAGLSRGLLVTEAPRNSGSLITANCAHSSGRDVFAVPRSVTDTVFLGTNDLIQRGAKLINCAEDIICEYPYAKRLSVEAPPPDAKKHTYEPREDKSPPKIKIIPKTKAKTIDNEKYAKLNDTEKAIINTLKIKDMQIDEIIRELDMPAGELNIRLLKLEISGLIKKLPGSVYQLNA